MLYCLTDCLESYLPLLNRIYPANTSIYWIVSLRVSYPWVQVFANFILLFRFCSSLEARHSPYCFIQIVDWCATMLKKDNYRHLRLALFASAKNETTHWEIGNMLMKCNTFFYILCRTSVSNTFGASLKDFTDAHFKNIPDYRINDWRMHEH